MNDLLTLPLTRPIDFTSAGGRLRRRRVGQALSVLYFTAHPDDEDAATITYLCRALGVRVALWCATRGEGGEDHAGGTMALGARRTHELLAAAAWYGLEDVEFGDFSDLGYTTALDETRWDLPALVDAMTAAITKYRPSIVMSRFVGAPSDGHGHHQAVGRAAVGAFERNPCEALLAFDPQGDVAFDVGAPLDGYGLSAARLGAYGMAEHRTQHGGVLTEPGASSVRRYRTVAGTATFPPRPPADAFAAALQRRRAGEAVAFERGFSLVATATAEGDRPFDRFYDPAATFAGPVAGARFVVDARSEGPEVELELDAPDGWSVQRLAADRWAVVPDATRGALRVVAALDDARIVRAVQRRSVDPPFTRVAL